MIKTIRVFLQRTSYTPIDGYVFIGLPPLPEFIPEHDEIHISCTFTWDRANCEHLAYQWEGRTNKPVKLGGPAFGSVAEDFKQGMYLKQNIIFTTRGCNNQCHFCSVPRLEGRLKELPVCQGNVIQDSNFLQASRIHKDRVFAMLRGQRSICFKGGLQADLVDSHFIDNITSLNISEIWLSCDSDDMLPQLKAATIKLVKAGFNREKIKCYALIGDDMEKNEARLQEIYHAGAMPFAMLYRDFTDIKTNYTGNWGKFARMWQRPAAITAHMERGTEFWDRGRKNTEGNNATQIQMGHFGLRPRRRGIHNRPV
jgi:hypothetical protein